MQTEKEVNKIKKYEKKVVQLIISNISRLFGTVPVGSFLLLLPPEGHGDPLTSRYLHGESNLYFVLS